MKRAALVCLVTLHCASLSTGATGEDAPIGDLTDLAGAVDDIFSSYENATPGCAVGVIHEGHYILKQGYGLANLEHDIPITSISVFRTGSLSKQFTAMAIALLVERGQIDLDADVLTYLPDLRDYGHEVTIRQMVHHLAGMDDYETGLFFKDDGTEFRFGNEDYWTIEEFYDNKLGSGKTDLIAMTTTTHTDVIARDHDLFESASYAFGHFVGTSHGQPVIGHSGGWVGFTSLYLRYPELSLSVVTFCNSTDADATTLGNRVAALYVDARVGQATTGGVTPARVNSDRVTTDRVRTDHVTADFARFRKDLATAEPEEQARLTNDFVDQVGGTPVVAASTVIFLAEGRGSGPVRLFGDFNAWARYQTGTSLDRGEMSPLEQSGWFYRELELEPEARIEYLFADNEQEPWLDPNNPAQIQSFGVRHSELRMPGYARRRSWSDSSEALQGSLESFEVKSELLGNTRQVSVYLPPIEDAANAGLPVLFVNDGSLYRELGFHRIVDTLIAEDSIRPIAIVMVDPVNRNPEYRDDPNFNRFFAQELQEVLSARYRFSVEPAERGVVGGSRGGLGALIACWRHPEVFGLCGLLSPAVTPVTILDEIYVEPVKPLRFFMTGGLYDLRWYGDYLRVRDTLLYRGYDLTYRVMPEGHTPNAWLAYLPDLLLEFFGP